MKRVVFVMGSGRSGTTMVRDMLGKHPDVCALPETSFYDRLWAARYLIGRVANPKTRLKFVWLFFHACGDGLIKQFLPRQEIMAASYVKMGSFGHKDFFDRMCEALSGSPDKVIVEKTPHHLLFMEFIAKKYPDARFVYITRDPVNMISSYIARGDLPDNYQQVAMEWLVGNEVGLACLEQYGERIVHVRYEDILESPKVYAKKIFDFAGVSFDEEYLNIGSNSTFDKSFSLGIRKQKADTKALSDRQIRDVWRVTGSVAGRLGYHAGNGRAVDIRWLLFRLKYKMKYWLCLAGIRPLRIMLDAGKIKEMNDWVRKHSNGC